MSPRLERFPLATLPLLPLLATLLLLPPPLPLEEETRTFVLPTLPAFLLLTHCPPFALQHSLDKGINTIAGKLGLGQQSKGTIEKVSDGVRCVCSSLPLPPPPHQLLR